MTTEFSGRGDPARSIALLWRTDELPARGRGPKPGLTVDRIAAAAIELADAEGLAGLSMRRVAERLGVGAMSLYTYVPGKAELIDVMLDMVYAEAGQPLVEGGDWRTKLERIARENWAMYHRHPWMLQVATPRPVLGPNATARYDHELRAVDGVGLTDVEMDSVVSLLAGHVEGAARRSIEATQAERRTGMTDLEWWEAHAPLLEKVLDLERYPVAARVGTAAGEEYGAASDPARAFEFGLQRILDGIAALIDSRSAG